MHDLNSIQTRGLRTLTELECADVSGGMTGSTFELILSGSLLFATINMLGAAFDWLFG